MRRELAAAGVDPARFGWASVQLDGGIDKVLAKIESWFADRLAAPAGGGPPARRLAELLSLGPPDREPRRGVQRRGLWRPRSRHRRGRRIGAGARDRSPPRAAGIPGAGRVCPPAAAPTLVYGQAFSEPGFHIVRTESRHWTENLTGLAGCGAQIALALVRGRPGRGTRWCPSCRWRNPAGKAHWPPAISTARSPATCEADRARLLELVLAVAGGNRLPAAAAAGLVEFQLTRGLLGIST